MSTLTFTHAGTPVKIKIPYYSADESHTTFIGEKGKAISIHYTEERPKIRQGEAWGLYSPDEPECSEAFFMRHLNRAIKCIHPAIQTTEEKLAEMKKDIDQKANYIIDLSEENQNHKKENARLEAVAFTLGVLLLIEAIVGICISIAPQL